MKYIILIYQILAICFFFTCSREATKITLVKPSYDTNAKLDIDESYETVKEKWTVKLISAGMKRSPAAFGMMGPVGGGRGPGFGGDFPLIISATLMDHKVIATGFQYYSQLLEMTPREEETLRQNFTEFHDPEHFILIETTLMTSWTEIYMDLNRWTIFLEDDRGNQYEPVKIVEQQIPILHTEKEFPDSMIERPEPFRGKIHQKQIFLYFSRKDHYGHRLINREIKQLKLVFVQNEGSPLRAEGVWTFLE